MRAGSLVTPSTCSDMYASCRVNILPVHRLESKQSGSSAWMWWSLAVADPRTRAANQGSVTCSLYAGPFAELMCTLFRNSNRADAGLTVQTRCWHLTLELGLKLAFRERSTNYRTTTYYIGVPTSYRITPLQAPLAGALAPLPGPAAHGGQGGAGVAAPVALPAPRRQARTAGCVTLGLVPG